MEETLHINSGQVLETTVTFGSLTGSTDVKLNLPSYVTAAAEARLPKSRSF